MDITLPSYDDTLVSRFEPELIQWGIVSTHYIQEEESESSGLDFSRLQEHFEYTSQEDVSYTICHPVM